MKAIRIDLPDAETVKKDLIKLGIMSREYKVLKGDGFVYFPVLENYKDYKVHDVDLERSVYRLTFRELLEKKLNKKEIEMLKTSYDVVGDIAIVEIDEELRSKEKEIGEAILSTNKNVKTVLRKDGAHEGVFRVQENVFLAGEDKRDTIHVENGLKFAFDVDNVYFSPRLGNERMRIASLVKPGERVLVMFSGCGVYPITISRYSEAAEIVGVEINPAGHEAGLENIELNKIDRVKLFCGDVRKIVPSLGEFDRIIMPLPKDAVEFLDVAKQVSHVGTVVHLYAFKSDFEEIWDEIEAKIGKVNRVDLVKCCQIGPRKHRISADFEILA